jgi:hypothetical protein
MATTTDTQHAAHCGTRAVAFARLGQGNDAREWTIHAVRAGARALAGLGVTAYTAGPTWAQLRAQELADSLRACTGAVSVTVTDGAATATAK